MVVELQAVEQSRFAVHAENIVGEQVAVAVDYAALFDPAREKKCTARNEFGDTVLNPLDRLVGDPRNRHPRIAVEFRQVLAPALVDRTAVALGIN